MAITVSDNFNRANSTTTLGSTPVGNKPWANYGTATWGITGGPSAGLAYPVTTPTYDKAVYFDAGIADNLAFSIKTTVRTTKTQVYYRMVSDGNGFGIEAGAVYRINANTWTKIMDLTGWTAANNDVIRVELRGNEHKIYINNTLRGTFTDTAHATGTKFGFSGDTTATRFDDVSIDTLTPVSTNLYMKEDFADNVYVFSITQGTIPWAWSSAAAPNGNTGHIASGTTPHSGTSSATFALSIPSAATTPKIEVDYSVSSEATFDFIKILIDGVERFSESGTKSGTAVIETTSGAHTLELRYVKDGSTVAGNDKAYVSEIRLYADGAAPAVKIGEKRIKHPSRIISIPIYSITNFPAESLRVQTVDGIGFISLVLVTDPSASAIRLQTTKGLRALKL